MCKKVVSYFMCVMVLVTYFGWGTTLVSAKEENYVENNAVMLKAATNYAKEYYKEMVEIVVDEMQEEMGVSISDMKHIKLGKPYYFYDVEAEEQKAEFYFPIYDKGEIILMMHVTCTEEGWTASMDTEDTHTLNQLDYENEECVFYCVGDDVYAENGNQKVHMRGDGKNDNAFKNKEVKEKQKEIGLDKKKIVPVEFEGAENSNVGARTLSYSTSTGRYLAMSNYYIPQGDYALCWAACVATTYRFRNNSLSLTPEAVAERLGENYKSDSYEGATTDDVITTAYNLYGFAYRRINTTASWSQIKKDINKEYPIGIIGEKGEYKHMVLINAYNELENGSKYVKIWDPQDHDVQLVQYYDGMRIAFESGGFNWGSTMSFVFCK